MAPHRGRSISACVCRGDFSRRIGMKHKSQPVKMTGWLFLAMIFCSYSHSKVQPLAQPSQ